MNSGRPRIYNAEPVGYSPLARAVLQEAGKVVNARPVDGRSARLALLKAVAEADALIVRVGFQVDREVIDAAPRLKVIVSATTGLDHIDVEYASARRVAVLSLQGETEFLDTVPATAEHTWALLLALVRGLPAAVEAVRAGEWDRDRHRGRELAGCRLGLVGFGRIGRLVANYGLAFGMKVLAFDPYVGAWPPEVVDVEDLGALLGQSDVLSLHAALTPETWGMIDARALARLSARAVLVNTARGELVDEGALVAALESGHLAGAALDVVHHERDPEARLASPLLRYAAQHPNLLITPHLGGVTHESMERTEIFMAQRLVRFLAEAPTHA